MNTNQICSPCSEECVACPAGYLLFTETESCEEASLCTGMYQLSPVTPTECVPSNGLIVKITPITFLGSVQPLSFPFVLRALVENNNDDPDKSNNLCN